MKTSFIGAAALGAAALFALAGSAQAQGYGLSGSAAGVCVLNGNQLVATSAVGKAVDARLKQLQAQVTSELTPEKTSIENDIKALQTAYAAATTAAARQPLQAREQALNTRANTYQQKVSQRQAEMQATTQKALQRISTEANPLIRQVGSQRACGVILDSGSVIDANPAMDITTAAVAALDAKITTFTFNRETVAAQAAGQ